MRTYLNGTEPEYCKEYTNQYLAKTHKEYPSGVIDVVGKLQLCEAEGLASRLNYDDAFKMFEAYGFRCQQKNGKETKIGTYQQHFYDGDDVIMGTFLPSKEKKEVFLYPIHASYGDDSYGTVERSRCEIDDAIARYKKFFQEVKEVATNWAQTRGDQSFDSVDSIRFDTPWFNNRTDLTMLNILSHELGIYYPSCMLVPKSSKRGYFPYINSSVYRSFDEYCEAFAKECFSFIALSALFVHPGTDIIWETIPQSMTKRQYNDWKFDGKGFPPAEHAYLIANSDTGVRIETYPQKYSNHPSDSAEKEYNKLLKRPCPDDYIELRMENRSGCIRIPKELTDGRVSVDGVPLDLYECIRFDSEENAYIIMKLPRYDMPETTLKIQDYNVSLYVPEFTWADYIFPKKNDRSCGFPGIPRIDALHFFLNEMEPTYEKFMQEDLEAIVHVSKTVNFSLGNLLKLESDRKSLYRVDVRTYEKKIYLSKIKSRSL